MDRINNAIEIPDGQKVGEYVRSQLIENAIINPDGSLQEDLEVRVFDRRMFPQVLSKGIDGNNLMTWAWPYYPNTWEYNTVTADSTSNHPGGFAFYKKDGMEYVTGEPGKRRFVKSPLECLVAVFKYHDSAPK